MEVVLFRGFHIFLVSLCICMVLVIFVGDGVFFSSAGFPLGVIRSLVGIISIVYFSF